MQLNEVTFGGYVGRDAEDDTTKSGVRVVNFSVCHTEKARKDGGEDHVTWVRVKVFGGWCESAANIRRGDNVVVRGKLIERKWKERDTGKERATLELVAFQVGVLQRDLRSTTMAPYKNTPDLNAEDTSDVPF